MLEGKAIAGETDMLQTMQKDALHLAAKALDIFEATESTDIARFINKKRILTGLWTWVAILAILLFRGAVNQAREANLFPTFEALDA
ncbi:hypothetical protein like AT4G27360 [Hibiscus trionum]|uniref:Uncharacterized protein n=1 Tax=Hibiscus trionum TaxID=183268 RepID=A0A9W7IAA9_HIBTR|nr:hypothetical protein like AT4G27360 [Hibiscus trionum]